MNRQYKRMMKKQEAQKQKAPRSPRPQPGGPGGPGAGGRKPRTSPRQFVREVVAELRKVAWPTRQEVIGYSIVVLISVVVIAALIFAMDLAFTKGILELFGVEI